MLKFEKIGAVNVEASVLVHKILKGEERLDRRRENMVCSWERKMRWVAFSFWGERTDVNFIVVAGMNSIKFRSHCGRPKLLIMFLCRLEKFRTHIRAQREGQGRYPEECITQSTGCRKQTASSSSPLGWWWAPGRFVPAPIFHCHPIRLPCSASVTT